MAKRDVFERYAGQLLGGAWAIAHPLLLMSVYLFIFGFVFRTRVGGTRELPLDYTAYVLSGLVPWLSIQEALNRASTAITGSASLVKQVVFPVEVLPVKSVVASLLPQAVSLTVLTAYILWSHGSLHATYALLPALVVMQVSQMIGLSLLLSAVGVYVRDLKDVVQFAMVVGIYLLPIFYLPAMVPSSFRPLLYLNPFSYLVWCYQDASYFGRFEHPWAWVVSAVLSGVVFSSGWFVFRRLRPTFGNAL
jgi:lipopolysaccharide transport system permease protein